MDEINYIIEGEVIMPFDGLATYIPAGKEYTVKVSSGWEILSVFSPPHE